MGYARSPLTDQQLRDKLRPRLSGSDEERDAFLKHCTYVQGAAACQPDNRGPRGQGRTS